MEKIATPRFVWHDQSNHHTRQFVATRYGRAAGAITFQEWGPQRGNWYWTGNIPEGYQGRPSLPNSGYEPTPLAAALQAERYWRENGGP